METSASNDNDKRQGCFLDTGYTPRGTTSVKAKVACLPLKNSKGNWTLFCARNKQDAAADNLVLTLAAEVGGLFFGRYMMTGLRCAYPRFAMAFIMLFYVARRVRYEKLMELLVTLTIAIYFSNQTFATPKINGLQYDLSVQFFAVIALLFIWLYNGERGSNKLIVRYVSYGFFPVAILIFWYLASQGVTY